MHSGTDYNKFKWHDGLLFFKNLLYVPKGSSRCRVIQNYHDTYMAGHFSSNKTLDLVTQSFWWPHLRKFVEDYIRTCDTYCRAKMHQHHPYGLLQPLPIPSKSWQPMSLGFIIDFPHCKGFHATLPVVEWYTKMTHLLSCAKYITIEETTNLVMCEIFLRASKEHHQWSWTTVYV